MMTMHGKLVIENGRAIGRVEGEADGDGTVKVRLWDMTTTRRRGSELTIVSAWDTDLTVPPAR